MDLKEIDVLGADIHSHWYYKSKAKAVKHFLKGYAPTNILDVGAGSGFFSRYLLKNTGAKKAACIDINYEHEWSEVEAGKKIYFCKDIQHSDADLVLLMDVLEHVEDDEALLSLYVNKVANGTHFLISVPAFNFLWSGHDVFLGHHRRYSMLDVKAIIERSGLQVVQGSYYFGLVFPIAVISRLFYKLRSNKHAANSQLVRHSPFINYFLNLLCSIECPIMRFNRAMGLTVFYLAVKP
jgi:SAM-dependent methyltransferase